SRVSTDSSGVQGDAVSFYASISADGRYVSFTSEATNLVPGDTNGSRDMFVRDLLTATTERVSVATGGAQGTSNSAVGSISPDGRYVVFASASTNFIPNAIPGQVYLRDRQNGTTEVASVST